MNTTQNQIIQEWIDSQIYRKIIGAPVKPAVWMLINKASTYSGEASDFAEKVLVSMFGEGWVNEVLTAAFGLIYVPDTMDGGGRVIRAGSGRRRPDEVLVKDADPELERLLAEEEEIERNWRENQ